MIENQEKFLILAADDLGGQYANNAGILDAAQNGALTSASIMANGAAFADAVERVLPACPRLGVGVHLTLNEGNCVAPPAQIPALADADGHFRFIEARGFVRLALSGGALREQAALEMRAQIEKVKTGVEKTGRALDHLDGHMHCHAIPWLWQLTLKLAAEYAVPFVRLPREPLRLAPLRAHFPRPLNFAHYANLQTYAWRDWRASRRSPVRTNDYFYGLLHSGAMNETVAAALLRAQRENAGVTEMAFHPCVATAETYYLEPYVKDLCNGENRAAELSALKSPQLRAVVEQCGYQLTNYREIAMKSD
ncbi:hydrolase [Planctomycetales bacterium]|nr:hydrolase [Planctomycetales bacterium]